MCSLLHFNFLWVADANFFSRPYGKFFECSVSWGYRTACTACMNSPNITLPLGPPCLQCTVCSGNDLRLFWPHLWLHLLLISPQTDLVIGWCQRKYLQTPWHSSPIIAFKTSTASSWQSCVLGGSLCSMLSQHISQVQQNPKNRYNWASEASVLSCHVNWCTYVCQVCVI